MSPAQLLKFRARLERGGRDLFLRYLTDKAGFDSKWEDHKELVMKVYTDDGLIGDEYTDSRYICIMSEGLTTEEVRQCQVRRKKQTTLALASPKFIN
jgi:hypothetical protein